MKSYSLIFSLCLLAISQASTGQDQNSDPKKALDAFITATTKAENTSNVDFTSSPQVESLPPVQEKITTNEHQIKREKGDASKPGDKYMGQVAHFAPVAPNSVPSEPVPGAEITVEQVSYYVPKKLGSGESGPAEKTQFDVILKSKESYVTDKTGAFTLNLSKIDLTKTPTNAVLIFKFSIKISSQNQFHYESNIVEMEITKPTTSELPLFLQFTKTDGKSNKGTFAVNGKTQS